MMAGPYVVADFWNQCSAICHEAIRSMIERIVVTPRDCGGVDLALHGDLARILALCAGNAKTPPHGETGFLVSLVAGAGFEPTTFRL